jgi:hypothetical protein
MNQAYLIQCRFLAAELKRQAANPNDVQLQLPLLSSFSFVPYELDSPDAELSFSRSLRENGIFMWLSNMHEYGHLVQSEGYATLYKNGDLWEIHRNRFEWENRYLNANYSKVLSGEQVIEQPCPDVFWFPIVSEKFCDHLIEELERFGSWSSGKNEVTGRVHQIHLIISFSRINWDKLHSSRTSRILGLVRVTKMSRRSTFT